MVRQRRAHGNGIVSRPDLDLFRLFDTSCPAIQATGNAHGPIRPDREVVSVKWWSTRLADHRLGSGSYPLFVVISGLDVANKQMCPELDSLIPCSENDRSTMTSMPLGSRL